MIILDIDMPQSCWQCTLNTHCSECEGYPDSCAAKGFYESKKCEYGKDNGRPDWCPIVGEIPNRMTDKITAMNLPPEQEAIMRRASIAYEKSIAERGKDADSD